MMSFDASFITLSVCLIFLTVMTALILPQQTKIPVYDIPLVTEDYDARKKRLEQERARDLLQAKRDYDKEVSRIEHYYAQEMQDLLENELEDAMEREKEERESK